MSNFYTFKIPTEQGYEQSFNFTKKDLQQFKDLLTTGGTKHIGNYSLRVENSTLNLYKSRTFNGPSYAMDIEEALEIVLKIL